MFEDLLEELDYESRILIDDVKLGIASKEDVVSAIDNLRKIRDKADKVLRDLTAYVTAYEEKELEEEMETTEEIFESGEETEKPPVVRLPLKDAIIVALSRSKIAGDRFKEEARKIIEEYGLTEEEIRRIVEWFYK